MSNSLWPHDCSMPGFPVYHQLPELAQTHVYWVGDAIQPSHPLSSPSPPSFNLSQHQGFFPMSPFFVSGGQSIVYVLQRIVYIIQNPALYAYDEVIFSICDLLNHIYLMWFTWFLLNRNMYCLHITRYSLHITKYSIVCLWLHDF